MRRDKNTITTLIAAAAIAFASTVSAVHVHDIITCSQSSPVVVQNMHDIHDCIFCWVVYQTISADAIHSDIVNHNSELVLQEYVTAPFLRLSSGCYGRAPPSLA